MLPFLSAMRLPRAPYHGQTVPQPMLLCDSALCTATRASFCVCFRSDLLFLPLPFVEPSLPVCKFAVPPPAQHLQLHSGDELGDGDHVGYGARVVMTERIAITAIWTEHGKELRQLSIQLGGSTKVADFKRILAEKSGIPAGQIVLRSDHDSSRCAAPSARSRMIEHCTMR
eukprot:SAG31_NODE_682_length_12841_cov_13.637655_8_plen_171_part_00